MHQIVVKVVLKRGRAKRRTIEQIMRFPFVTPWSYFSIELTLIFVTNFSPNHFFVITKTAFQEAMVQKVFCKKSVHRNFTKFTVKHLRQSLFLIKLQA